MSPQFLKKENDGLLLDEHLLAINDVNTTVVHSLQTLTRESEDVFCILEECVDTVTSSDAVDANSYRVRNELPERVVVLTLVAIARSTWLCAVGTDETEGSADGVVKCSINFHWRNNECRALVVVNRN